MRGLAMALALALVPGALHAQSGHTPLPQGIRARVWSRTAGPVAGRIMGQPESVIIVAQQFPGACRRVIARSLELWSDGLTTYRRIDVPAECPIDMIVIDGRDVERIDVSRGWNRARQIGRWTGSAVGFGGGFALVAMDPLESDSDTIAYGVLLGGLGGLAGYLVGDLIGGIFEHESWRRIW